QWAVHCESVALALGVGFKCLRVNAQKTTRQSQEEVARDARYQALKALLTENDVLLLAQHREDQMETVLLQLFRGAGIQGLSGMPLVIDFGLGQMIRPFLDVSKQAINAYAALHQIHWVEDPSNQSDNFDRNFLRNQIFPQLKQRWPALDKTVARSARHCANSQVVSQGLAVQLLHGLHAESDKSLDIVGLLALEWNQQQLVVRQWFAKHQLRMPSEKILQRVLVEVAGARKDANPELKTTDYCIRRYRDKLYCLSVADIEADIEELCWLEKDQPLEFKKHCFLSVKESSAGINKQLWDKAKVVIKPRCGSEKIALPGRQGRHTLKKLFQEKAIPPWERDAIPLLYLDGQLAAVGDLWVSSAFYSTESKGCYQIVLTKS
ncbi:MAG: tRNA lysidine(34) synthetase TilS, partial [Methylococcales bacterium]|nr:tRNA lysidine(34) synthetase TilS [Methylococcales bacterium]